ncbi:MAG: HAD family hydrolase [Deltaproteobacteria bacterium]|nr:HAD family hydrolase [Deltaproteobacteria bacterium]
MLRPDIRAVLFDMDGVLIDSYEAWFALVKGGTAVFGGNAVTREAFAAGWGQGVDEDVRTFFPGRTVAEVERYYEDAFANVADQVVVSPQAREIFEVLRARGIKTAVLSNTPGPLTRKIVQTLKLKADLALGGADAGRPKPAPDLLRRACERFGVPPAAALMVGDSRFDREAAAAAGVAFVGMGTIEAEARIASLGELMPLLGEPALRPHARR